MKIEAVKMMRNIRDQMSLDMKGMSYQEEQKYLSNHITTFEYRTEIMASNWVQSTTIKR